MLHTVEIKKRDISDVDTDLNNYAKLCLSEFKGGNIIVEETKLNNDMSIFKCVDISDVIEPDTGDTWIRKNIIGFFHWDKEVINLDDNCSDEAMCFNMSSRLNWEDVELTLRQGSRGSFKAKNIERLKEALSHIYIAAWCALDI